MRCSCPRGNRRQSGARPRRRAALRAEAPRRADSDRSLHSFSRACPAGAASSRRGRPIGDRARNAPRERLGLTGTDLADLARQVSSTTSASSRPDEILGKTRTLDELDGVHPRHTVVGSGSLRPRPGSARSLQSSARPRELGRERLSRRARGERRFRSRPDRPCLRCVRRDDLARPYRPARDSESALASSSGVPDAVRPRRRAVLVATSARRSRPSAPHSPSGPDLPSDMSSGSSSSRSCSWPGRPRHKTHDRSPLRASSSAPSRAARDPGERAVRRVSAFALIVLTGIVFDTVRRPWPLLGR